MATKTLLLLRHGKSGWDDPSLEDLQRPLTPRGRRAAAVMATYIQGASLIPDLILCSPAARARETFAVAARLWSAPPMRLERPLYAGGSLAILERLRTLDDAIARAMVVGHNPGLQDLAGMLVADGEGRALDAMQEKFPTAALAVIRLDTRSWADVRAGAGHLVEFVTPKGLV